MEEKLRRLFIFQEFMQDEKLKEITDDVEKRYSNKLTDDELSFVNAAGSVISRENKKDKL